MEAAISQPTMIGRLQGVVAIGLPVLYFRGAARRK